MVTNGNRTLDVLARMEGSFREEGYDRGASAREELRGILEVHQGLGFAACMQAVSVAIAIDPSIAESLTTGIDLAKTWVEESRRDIP